MIRSHLSLLIFKKMNTRSFYSITLKNLALTLTVIWVVLNAFPGVPRKRGSFSVSVRVQVYACGLQVAKRGWHRNSGNIEKPTIIDQGSWVGGAEAAHGP